MTELLKTLTARGLLQDVTSGLDERLEQGPLTAYVGYMWFWTGADHDRSHAMVDDTRSRLGSPKAVTASSSRSPAESSP